LIFHPDDEELTSDILAVIVKAVLLAHSAASKAAGKLPQLSAERRLDPMTSTVQAARCFGWAAQTLGMSPPLLYAAPEIEVLAQLIPTVPPLCGLGKLALSGRTPQELAFVAGQQLAYYRPERFIRLVVPDVVDLQDLFLAALAIGNPKLPLNADVRSRVEPIARAVEPLLASREVDACARPISASSSTAASPTSSAGAWPPISPPCARASASRASSWWPRRC